MTSAPHDKKHGHYLPPNFPAPVRALAALSRLVAVLEGIGIGVSLAALIALALWQSLARTGRMNLGLNIAAAPDWTNNVLRHSVFIIGFLGAMFATFTARHLRVDAVTRLAGVRVRLAIRLVATGGAIAVAVYIVKAAWAYRAGVIDEIAESGQLFTAARGAMIIVVGISGMIFHFVVQWVIDATYLITRREVPEWWIAEAVHGGEVEVEVDSKTDAPEAAL